MQAQHVLDDAVVVLPGRQESALPLVCDSPHSGTVYVIAGSSGGAGELGLFCSAAAGVGAKDTVILKFATGSDGCVDAGGTAGVPCGLELSGVARLPGP